MNPLAALALSAIDLCRTLRSQIDKNSDDRVRDCPSLTSSDKSRSRRTESSF